MKILLVRLRLIGDVVFTTPVVRALRRRYPDADITYLVETAAAPVVAHNPHLSRVITIPKRRGWARLKDDLRLAATLRSARFDVAIDLHGGPRSGWLTWATRAPRRIGYDIQGRGWMYTTQVHRPRELRPRHSVANQWDLLPALDAAFGSEPDRDADRVEMHVGNDVRRALEAKRAAWALPSALRLVVLHVSAGNPFRRWPEASFASVAARLATSGLNCGVIITSGPSDAEAAARVIHDARARAGANAPRIVSDLGLSLEELRALVDEAALYIGGDSGPLHIASTSNVPIVGLYGPTLAARSAPWRPATIPTASLDAGPLPCRPCDQRICAPGDYRCLTQISPEAVFDAAARVLSS